MLQVHKDSKELKVQGLRELKGHKGHKDLQAVLELRGHKEPKELILP